MTPNFHQGDVDPAGVLRFKADAMTGSDELVGSGEEIDTGAHSPIRREYGACTVKTGAGETIPRIPAIRGIRHVGRQESLIWAGGGLVGCGFLGGPMVLSELIPCGLPTSVQGGSCLVTAQTYFLMGCFGDFNSGNHSKNRQRGREEQGLYGHDGNCATCERMSVTLMHMARR